jgi:hypothetical protein
VFMLRDTKVGDFADTVKIHEDVIRLQITMQDALRMKVREPIYNLLRAVSSQVLIETSSQFPVAFPNRASGHILQKSVVFASVDKICTDSYLTHMLKYWSVCSYPR